MPSGSESSEGTSQVLNENVASAEKSTLTSTSVSGEKRRVERTRTDQLLYVELGTGNGGILLDVSEEGCGFLSIAPVWDPQPHFAFSIGAGRKIQGDGKVVWVDKSKKLGGLRFVNASPAFRQQVRAWLAQPKVEAPQPEPKATSQANILEPIEPRSNQPKPIGAKPIEAKSIEAAVDSPAKQRRKQLREEAKAKIAEKAAHAAESGEGHGVRGGEPHPKTTSDHIFLHAPKQGAWAAFLAKPGTRSAVAAVVLGAAVVALGIVYREQAGTALMRLGTSLAGKQAQVTSASESSAVPNSPASVPANPPPAETMARPAEINTHMSDAVEHQAAAVNAADNAEPVKQVEQPNAGPSESDAPSRQTPPASTKKVAERSAFPAFQKLRPAAEEPILKKPGRGTQAEELPQTRQVTSAAPTVEAKKKEAHHATAEQVQALWSEVEGGDVSAEVALGELYARGNGVPKSCGQARMLLNSAVKKGSDEARQKLEQLGDQGCP